MIIYGEAVTSSLRLTFYYSRLLFPVWDWCFGFKDLILPIWVWADPIIGFEARLTSIVLGFEYLILVVLAILSTCEAYRVLFGLYLKEELIMGHIKLASIFIWTPQLGFFHFRHLMLSAAVSFWHFFLTWHIVSCTHFERARFFLKKIEFFSSSFSLFRPITYSTFLMKIHDKKSYKKWENKIKNYHTSC